MKLLLGFLPGWRYTLRELLPRAIVFALVFEFLSNHLPGVAFHGGFVAAGVLGFCMMLNFMLFGGYVFNIPCVSSFLTRNKETRWLMPMMICFMVVEPMAAIAFVAVLSGGVLVLHGILAALTLSVVLNLGCMLTHDYGWP